jgi:hypothetical protein
MNLSQTVGTLNLLGDESRVRLCALLRAQELSVSELVRVTGLAQSRVSDAPRAAPRRGLREATAATGRTRSTCSRKRCLSGAARAVLDEP